MCRAYWMVVGGLVAFNALIWLAVANEILRRAEGSPGAAGERLGRPLTSRDDEDMLPCSDTGEYEFQNYGDSWLRPYNLGVN